MSKISPSSSCFSFRHLLRNPRTLAGSAAAPVAVASRAAATPRRGPSRLSVHTQQLRCAALPASRGVQPPCAGRPSPSLVHSLSRRRWPCRNRQDGGLARPGLHAPRVNCWRASPWPQSTSWQLSRSSVACRQARKRATKRARASTAVVYVRARRLVFLLATGSLHFSRLLRLFVFRRTLVNSQGNPRREHHSCQASFPQDPDQQHGVVPSHEQHRLANFNGRPHQKTSNHWAEIIQYRA